MIDRIKKSLDIGKPLAATMTEWREWRETTKKNQPIAYLIMETLPEKVGAAKKALFSPYHSLRHYIRYRFIDRYHVINTGLKPGYHDVDARLLNGSFSLIVDFVEVELAWMHVVFDNTARKEFSYPWWSLGWTRFKSFRNPDAGLAHLKWEMTLDNENLPSHERNPIQAATAREIWELYHWWKYIRPKRSDPFESSGLNEWFEGRSLEDVFDGEMSADDRKKERDMLNLSHEIEASYEQEDQEMLIRLVKIRKSLWT